jgi:hypothetical protein
MAQLVYGEAEHGGDYRKEQVCEVRPVQIIPDVQKVLDVSTSSIRLP